MHAEANAIIAAARERMLGATIYMTCVDSKTGELVEGTRYVADGGILSVELETNSEGVFLIVRGEGIPSLDDVDLAVTEITLTVVSGYDDGTVTVLDKISVVVY